jgi:pyruvate dehydrogenase E2 component (dihydrolipoamide acetyltransferase)
VTDIAMPKLSDSMEEGTILSWLKAAGDEVALGEELLEIETDKSTVTYSAEIAGVLEILVAEGTTVPVGEPIARIGEPAADATPASEVPRSEREHPAEPPRTAAVADAPSNRNGQRDGGTAVATPLARRIASAHGIALDEVEGTGPLGRITRGDVEIKAGLAPARPTRAPNTPRPAPPPAPEPPPATAGPTRVQELTRLQQTIARRMTEAKATVPHFQVQIDVQMDAALALRRELAAACDERDSLPSVNDFVVKAAALALRAHPLANGSYTEDGFVLHDAINIGVPVATEAALVVPTVFDVASKSLGEIARDTRRLAQRVRSGEIAPRELEGATFTVSNLGMFGMTAITPVINPPQAAILGVGAARETLARVDGEIVERQLMTLTLSCDHRILYGADAARFLAEIRGVLESPLKLAL